MRIKRRVTVSDELILRENWCMPVPTAKIRNLYEDVNMSKDIFLKV